MFLIGYLTILLFTFLHVDALSFQRTHNHIESRDFVSLLELLNRMLAIVGTQITNQKDILKTEHFNHHSSPHYVEA